jgi:hypothetical protein
VSVEEEKTQVSEEPPAEEKLPFYHGFKSWKYLRAALPDLSLAVTYMLAAFWSVTFPGMEHKRLGYLMMIEFLVIHSFGFLGFLAMAKPTMKGQRPLQWIIFSGLVALYTVFAHSAGGISGIISFYSLGVVTYFGFLLNLTSERAKAHLMTRWLLSTFIYGITLVISGADTSMSNWTTNVGALYFGMLYFGVLGLLEWSAFYDSRPIRAIQRFVKDTQKKPEPPSPPTPE